MSTEAAAKRQAIESDLTWTGASFERGVKIAIGADGRIEQVGPDSDVPVRRLAGRAIIPGFVNAHSHAFQRGLRGLGESFPAGAGSFWTWREAMYELVQEMDGERIYELSRQAFCEMLAAGITTVGEFHYLHHDQSCAGFAFDEVVLRAAADAGVRIVLLNAYYRTGGIGQPLSGGQQRFRCASLDEYWSQMDTLASKLDPRTQSLGAVAHSIRAAEIEEIGLLMEEARRRGMVMHMHVEEQRREIEECEAALGCSPMASLNAAVGIDADFTAVHCTHTAGGDMETFLDAGGTVCICPLTEANLGDGIADVPQIIERGGRICLGTDSNARISFTEEMRWLEYVQRLHLERRGVCLDADGRIGSNLLEIATRNGARALGIDAGVIEPGAYADMIAIDLESPSLAGWTEDSLLEAFIFGSTRDAIAEVCVGGRWLDPNAA